MILMTSAQFRFYSPAPVSDYWWVVHDFRVTNDHPGLGWFWERTMDHRHVIPKILMRLDWLWFAGTGYALLGIGAAGNLFHAAATAWLSATLSGKRWLGVSIFGVMTYCLFHPLQMDNLLRPYQICFLFGFLGGPLAVAVLAYGAHVERRPKALWIAMGAALFGALSLASGLLIWPVLALAAWLLRYRWRDLILILLLGLAFNALYLYGFSDGKAPLPPFEPSRLKDYALFFIHLHSTPLNPIDKIFADRLTLLSLSVLGLLSLWVVLKRAPQIWLIWPLASLWFVWASMALTAYGRINSGFSDRYFTPGLVAWAYMAVLLLLAAAQSRRWWLLTSAQAAILVIIVPTAVQWPRAQAEIQAIGRRNDLAAASLATNVFDQASQIKLDGLGFVTIENQPYLVAQRKTFMATEPFRRVGGPAPSVIATGDCDATWRTTRLIPNRSGPGYQLLGEQSRPANVLVIQKGTVVGVGGPEPDRPQEWRAFVDRRAYGSRVDVLMQMPQGWCRFAARQLMQDPAQMPVISAQDLARWSHLWQAGDPWIDLQGAKPQLANHALELQTTRNFNFIALDTKKDLADWKTLIVRVRSDQQDLAGMLGIVKDGYLGEVPAGEEWVYMKIHLSRQADWKKWRYGIAMISIGSVYAKRIAISDLWGSNDPVPDSDLDIQFATGPPVESIARRASKPRE